MANTATVTSLSTLHQRNLIDRAVELKTLIDGAKDELYEILDQFKALGDNDYVGRDGHKTSRFARRNASLSTPKRSRAS